MFHAEIIERVWREVNPTDSLSISYFEAQIFLLKLGFRMRESKNYLNTQKSSCTKQDLTDIYQSIISTPKFQQNIQKSLLLLQKPIHESLLKSWGLSLPIKYPLDSSLIS
jgi:hypothetical protein